MPTSLARVSEYHTTYPGPLLQVAGLPGARSLARACPGMSSEHHCGFPKSSRYLLLRQWFPHSARCQHETQQGKSEFQSL